MDFDFSKTEKGMANSRIKLNTVYKLEADLSYDVTKSEEDRQGLILLRTLQGTGTVKIKGFDPRIVKAGTLLVFFNNKVRHYFCNHNHWDFWWFEFEINGSLSIPLNKIINIDILEFEVEHFHKCLKLLRKNDLSAKSLASSILSFLIHRWTYNFQEDKKVNTPHRESIDRLIEYMYAHRGDNLTVGEMASYCDLSVRRFRQVFKEEIQESPKKFYDKLKMDMAAELLNKTSLTVSEIAAELGYSNPFHFSKVFKKYLGVPPSQY